MKKIALSLLMLLLPAIAFSQAQAPAQPEVAADGIPNYPVQSIRSYEFDVRAITVSRQYETRGRGEILNVEFGIHNNTDYPMDLYVFAIATYEDYKKERSPYNPLLRSTERTALLNFVPFPLAAEDANKDFRSMKLENFRYTVGTGDDKKEVLVEFPKDPRLGVNPVTGQAYKLQSDIFVKTSHLSVYKNNYRFFNQVTVLIFDAKKLGDGKGIPRPLYRQVISIDGRRK